MGAGLGKAVGVVGAQTNHNPTSQQSEDPVMPSAPRPGATPMDDISGMVDASNRARMKENSVKAQNDSRHKRLEDDAGKLLALTTELKSDVDKSNKDELSLQVMRKAAEIEKLAHDVQSQMKN
jgi:hypothetical protein